MQNGVDPYRAPAANLEVAPDVQQPFHIVAPHKFFMLYIATFGLYGVYWWFVHWVAQRDVAGVRCRPAWRAVLAPFFAYSLFRRVAHASVIDQRQPGVGPRLLPVAAALVFLACSMLTVFGATLPRSAPPPLVLTLVFVPLLVEGLMLGILQAVINQVCGDPGGWRNRRLSGANIALIVFGGLYQLLVVLALLGA